MEGKASLVKERWTPQAAGGIPTGFAITARHTAGGWNPSASLCSAPPFDKGGFSTIRPYNLRKAVTMPQTPKLSPQQKLIIVEKILAGETSRQAAAKSVGVSVTAVRQWLRIYEAEGPDGLAPRTTSRHLTAEEKQAAVAAYLAGEGSLFDICKKYGIRSTQNLQKMVETVQAGGTLRGYHGASRHKGTAYTTAADREKIVRECLQNGCDYGAAALKYLSLIHI